MTEIIRENSVSAKELFKFCRVIHSFRPRFAGRCDRESRDLTQLTSGYNFAVKPITPNHHVRAHI